MSSILQRHHPARLLGVLVFAGLAAAGCNRGPEPLPPAVPQLLQTTVSVEPDSLPASVRKQKERVRAWKEMQSFYDKRGYQLAWSDAEGPLPRAEEMLKTIDKLASEGLDVRRYEHARLAELLRQTEADPSLDDPQAQRRLVDLDVQLTYTYLTLAAHIATGRLQPETLRIDWYTKPRNIDLDARLEATLAQKEGEIEKSLRSLAPANEEYDRLRDALAQYREIEKKGGWPQIPEGPVLKAGARGERVRTLRARLAVTGDLPAAPPSAAPASDLFDAGLTSAVSRFQSRHGLDANGVVDADTLEVLNVPYDVRIRQLQANLERWRWMPSNLGERYILVNIPEFRMELIENGKPAVAMRVVVGKTQSRTPVFSDKMTYLELNPAWNLPNSIVSDEIVPKLANDPGYLARNNMEVLKGWNNDAEAVDPGSVDWAQLGQNGSEYRLRQRPGPDNPLGKVKFMFPNEWDIYLHDTPADHLFAKEDRDFSHGCIRLERPLELAEYLLKDDPKWNAAAIQAKLASGEQETVTLKRPLPVHLVYWTSWVEKDGTVQFRKDLYGHDEALVEGLVKEPPVWLDLNAIRGEVQAAR